MIKQIFLLVSLISLLITTYMIFIWVPTELNLGISQRIFYYHVPLAWIGMISIFIVGIGSVVHLVTKNDKVVTVLTNIDILRFISGKNSL